VCRIQASQLTSSKMVEHNIIIGSKKSIIFRHILHQSMKHNAKDFKAQLKVNQVKQMYRLGEHKVNTEKNYHLSLSISQIIKIEGNKQNHLNDMIPLKGMNSTKPTSIIIWMTLSERNKIIIWSVLKIKSQCTYTN